MAKPYILWHDAVITAANEDMDGTGTVTFIGKPVDEDIFVDQIFGRPIGANVASLARLWVNNGDSHETAANNTFLTEKELPSTLALDHDVAYVPQVVITRLELPANHRLLITLGTAVTAGWRFTALTGDHYRSTS